jgi:hypothetical protein
MARRRQDRPGEDSLTRSAVLAAGSLLLYVTGAAAATPPVDPLDQKFGVASPPAYVKHYEADKSGKVLLNPYLQRASPEFPALLDAEDPPFKWVIDVEGRVSIIREADHPLGRTYEEGFRRPEDDSLRAPGTRETYGHVSALAGGPGRIGGEILYDAPSNSFTINNKSGRYTKHNPDRTPRQLVEAARLIHQVVDPGAATWGPVFYLLDYAPAELREKLLSDPGLEYDDPEEKSRPHLVVLEGGPSLVDGARSSAGAAGALGH